MDLIEENYEKIEDNQTDVILNVPTWDTDTMTYEDWRLKATLWLEQCLVENLPTKTIGLKLFENLSKIMDEKKVNEKLKIAFRNVCIDFSSETGFQQMIHVLDSLFRKTNLISLYKLWCSFIRFDNDLSKMEEYVQKFERKVADLQSYGINLPKEVLALQMIDSAGLSDIETSAVLTSVNTNLGGDLYNNTKLILKNNVHCRREPGREVLQPELTILRKDTSLTSEERKNANRSESKEPYTIENEQKPFYCNDCDKSFSTANGLKIHTGTHSGEKPHICSECSKSYTHLQTLKNHQKVHVSSTKPSFFVDSFGLPAHEDNFSFACDVCLRSFKTCGKLEVHKRRHTGEKPFACDQCSNSFFTAGGLKSHMYSHTGEKPFPCDQCTKSFTRVDNLNIHKRSHTGERPYKCDQCSKAFSYSGDLNAHKRIHTGERPYTCDVCFKAFSQTSHLRTHKRIHTGEKNFLCDQCSKSFSDAGKLTKHKRIHTGEKPHSCNQCPKSFVTNGDLKRHKRIHTGEKPYSCDQCPKLFTTSGDLRKHIRKHT